MCGIVGYFGNNNPVQKVLLGLERLEYRGYDSLGIAFGDKQGSQHIYKKIGLFDEFKKFIEEENISTFNKACIGHSRWATHGKVTEANAHPHSREHISLVHNGIIENAFELKKELISEGYQFLSETDSEIFLLLIMKELSVTDDLFQAIVSAFKKVSGQSAYVILDSKEEKIFCVKRGTPLICGVSENSSEVMISSDAYSFVDLAKEISYFEDDVICTIGGEQSELVQFYEFSGERSQRFMIEEQDQNIKISKKGNFEDFMIKEIFEQGELIRSLISYYLKEEGQAILKNIVDRRPRRILITACGTAAYAGEMIKYIIEKFNRISVQVELASELRYKDPLVFEDDLAIFISQSGETADTLAALRLLKEKNVQTLSIVNVKGSTLYRECHKNLLIRAGAEISVASTKAYTLQVLTGIIFSSHLDHKEDSLLKKYLLLADRIDDLLANIDEIKSIAEAISDFKGFLFTGRGHLYITALEGALKLKELTYLHAEGYAAGELKHGAIALADENMINIALVESHLYHKTISNIEEFRARKGKVLIIGPKDDLLLKKISDHYIGINLEGLEEIAPLYFNVVQQLIAYFIAKKRGRNIDHPRNLAKSVTVE